MSVMGPRAAFWLLTGALLAGCVTAPQFYAHEREFDEAMREQRGGQGAVGDARVAELGTQVDALQDEVSRLRGAVEEAKHSAEQALSEARSVRQATPSGGAARGNIAAMPVPGGPTPLSSEIRGYEEAFALYRGGEYEAAIDRFRSFLQNHESSDYADNALFWMGECYAKLGDYERAVLTFQDVVKRYPEGNKVPDALYRQGIALLEIGQRSGDQQTYDVAARQIFERIVRQHPQSERAAEAQRQLEALGP